MTLPVLQVVIGSTRPGRIGPAIAQWVAGQAEVHGGFAVEVVDLAQVNLPLFDEPHHPRLADYVHDHTKAWSATISRGDAFVFVCPEYNHGINAALKNALDYLYHEWQRKAAGFVSYGGVSAGTRAVQQLKQVAAALRMVPIVESVPLPFPHTHLDDSGLFTPGEAAEIAAKAMFDEIAAWTSATAAMRKN
jgi:NAD(P)H-dependent FMN reductase